MASDAENFPFYEVIMVIYLVHLPGPGVELTGWYGMKSEVVGSGLNWDDTPDNKLHGPFWGRQDQGGSHVGPVNLAIWDTCCLTNLVNVLEISTRQSKMYAATRVHYTFKY